MIAKALESADCSLLLVNEQYHGGVATLAILKGYARALLSMCEMNPSNRPEQERIRTVYRAWHGGKPVAAYSWHRPEVMEQIASQNRVIGQLLASAFGPDLSEVRALDVGCGTGRFLRQLITWGADPGKLAGTEYQEDRLEEARLRTAAGVHWHLGDLDFAAPQTVDFVAAQTVFSSILDNGTRTALAREMWRVLKPGGWCLIFDFRYNNPANPNVRKVTLSQLRSYWPAPVRHYRTLQLAPPIARRLARAPRLATELLVTLIPALRSHFVYMARKDG
jgi:SAM-dependent methyltransferase